MHQKNGNGTFTSKIGFVLAAVGSAVGMGNIWMFPYRTGQYGGAAFLIPYLLFIALFGYVGLSGEFAFGRMTGTGPIGSYEFAMKSRGKKGGAILGTIPLLGSLGIAIGYAIIVGWVLRSAFGALTGSLMSTEPEQFFTEMSSTNFSSVPWHTLVILLTAAVLIFGVSGGIEKINKVMMPAFFILFIIIAVRVAFLPNAIEGYKYLLVPQWEYLFNPRTWIMAMGQAFFSLSITGSGMIIYGSYLPKNEDVVHSSCMTAVLDTCAAMLAGFAILPSVFAFGLDPASGPKLLFITLLLGMLAYLASRNVVLCVLLNFTVPFALVFFQSDQFAPKGYFGYAMTFVFLELRPPTPEEFPVQMLCLLFCTLVLIGALLLYARLSAPSAPPEEEITRVLADMGQPAFRGKQVFTWLHRGVCSFDEMSNLSKPLRQQLAQAYTISVPTVARKQESRLDGTIKYLWELPDGNCIETVLMQYHHGSTVCISSQVGCRMGCAFCASTVAGKVRDLTAGEMLDQVLFTQLDSGREISNIVLMGIGEPLDNRDNVLRFLRLVNHPDGLNIGMRHISLSTCGVVPGIDALAEEDLQLTLSVSLHAPDSETRSRIMPVNRAWDVEELFAACHRYFRRTGRRISFEYAMIDGVNDHDWQADLIARRIAGMPGHVNLIPLNDVVESPFKPSRRIAAFQKRLESHGITATVRRSLGGDIDASCGQLRRRAMEERKGEDPE